MTESPTALTDGGVPAGIAGGLVAVTRGPAAGWIGRDGARVVNDTTGSGVADVAPVAAASLDAAVAADVADDGAGVDDGGVAGATAAVPGDD
jgi:hypothetical protein